MTISRQPRQQQSDNSTRVLYAHDTAGVFDVADMYVFIHTLSCILMTRLTK